MLTASLIGAGALALILGGAAVMYARKRDEDRYAEHLAELMRVTTSDHYIIPDHAPPADPGNCGAADQSSGPASYSNEGAERPGGGSTAAPERFEIRGRHLLN